MFFYKDEVIIRKQDNIVYCKDDIKLGNRNLILTKVIF